MASSNDSKSSSAASERQLPDLVPTPGPEDARHLHASRFDVAPESLERLNDLSAIRQFPQISQRRTTHAGYLPFEL